MSGQTRSRLTGIPAQETNPIQFTRPNCVLEKFLIVTGRFPIAPLIDCLAQLIQGSGTIPDSTAASCTIPRMASSERVGSFRARLPDVVIVDRGE